MRSLSLILPATYLLVAGVCHAQAANRVKTPEEAWNDITALIKPTTAITPPGQDKKTQAQLKAEANDKISKSRQAAQAAKDFYTANPTHVNAKPARKVEALSGLKGIADGDTAQEQTAKTVAKAYRNDQTNPANDRFDVALLAERAEVRGKFGGKVYAVNAPELELIAGKLHQEFGNTSDVFNFYASIARAADLNTARGIAAKLVQWQATPDAKAEAESILARHALLSTKVDLKLTATDGKQIDLLQQTGKPTILLFWSPGHSDTLSLLARMKKTLPVDTQVIYYCPTATARDAVVSAKETPVSGVFCYEPDSGANSAALRLGVRHFPYVFAFGRDGKLASFGPGSALVSVVTAVAR